MDAATAQNYIAPVEAAVSQAESEAAAGSDADARSGTAMLRRSVERWKGAQLNEVQAGTRDEAKWIEYGTDTGPGSGSLIVQAGQWIRDNDSLFSKWRTQLQAVGAAAQSVEDFVSAQIADWRKTVDGLKDQLVRFNATEEALQAAVASLGSAGQNLPAEAQDLLFGQTATEAAGKLTQLSTVLTKADQIVTALESGATAVFHGTDVMLTSDVSSSSPADSSTPDDTSDESVDPSQHGLVRVGQLQIAGFIVAGLVALITIAYDLNTWLNGYYSHANQELKSKDFQDALAATKDMDPASRAAVFKALGIVDKDPPAKKDPLSWLQEAEEVFGDLAKAGVVAGAVGTIIYFREPIKMGIKALVAMVKGRRATNPRKRRRRYA